MSNIQHIAINLSKEDGKYKLESFSPSKIDNTEKLIQEDLSSKPQYDQKKAISFSLALLSISFLSIKLDHYTYPISTNIQLFTKAPKNPAYSIHQTVSRKKNPSKWYTDCIKNVDLFQSLLKAPKSGSVTCHSTICKSFQVHFFEKNNPQPIVDESTLKQIYIHLADRAGWNGEELFTTLYSEITSKLLNAPTPESLLPDLLQKWQKELLEHDRWTQVNILGDEDIHIKDIFTSFRLSRIKDDYLHRGVSSYKEVLNRVVQNLDHRIHIYGDSGCGKTTLAKWTANRLFGKEKKPAILIILSQYINKLNHFPKLSLLDFFIQDCCGLPLPDKKNEKLTNYYNTTKHQLATYLEKDDESILILDGWDKMSKKQEEHVNLCLSSPTFASMKQIVISRPICRSNSGYQTNVRTYRLRPLTRKQSIHFLINNLDLGEYKSKYIVEAFPNITYFTPFFLVIYKYIFSHPATQRSRFQNFSEILEATIKNVFHSPLGNQKKANAKAAYQEMQEIAYNLSFSENKKNTYFFTKNMLIINSRLVSNRISEEDPTKIDYYEPQNYFFIHPIIQSYFASLKLITNPDLLKKKLHSHGLFPDRSKGWVLIAGLFHNHSYDEQCNLTKKVFWKFWGEQVKKPDLFRSVYAQVAQLLAECEVNDGGEKLLAGIDLRPLLLDEIANGQNLDSNINAYLSLVHCSSEELFSKIKNNNLSTPVTQHRIFGILKERNEESQTYEKIKASEINDKAREIVQITVQSSQPTKHLAIIIRSFLKLERINQAPSILLKGILENKNNLLLTRSCLLSLIKYSIETDATEIATLYFKRYPTKIKRLISIVISNCRNEEAIKMILKDAFDSKNPNIFLLKIMSKGHRFSNERVAALILQHILQISKLNESNHTYLAHLLRLFTKYYENSFSKYLNKIYDFIEQYLDSILKFENKEMIESITACYQIAPTRRISKESFDFLKQAIHLPRSSTSLVNAYSLLPVYNNTKKDINFLTGLINNQSKKSELNQAIISTLMTIAPSLVVRHYYETGNYSCRQALQDWFEIENVRIYENIIYRANGRKIPIQDSE